MSAHLLARIHSYVLSKSQGTEIVPVKMAVIEEAESKLGFKLPQLLKSCYVEIGNGGFGPGYGLIGFDGGAASDFGSITDAFNQLKSDHQALGNQWPAQLLPFCDWGCNIFFCVDCSDENSPIYTFDAGRLTPQGYNLQEFFEMWIGDQDILFASDGKIITRKITNPFTGEETIIRTHEQN